MKVKIDNHQCGSYEADRRVPTGDCGLDSSMLADQDHKFSVLSLGTHLAKSPRGLQTNLLNVDVAVTYFQVGPKKLLSFNKLRLMASDMLYFTGVPGNFGSDRGRVCYIS
jgi:hypothetical protein